MEWKRSEIIGGSQLTLNQLRGCRRYFASCSDVLRLPPRKMRTWLEKAHSISSVGTFMLTIVIVVLMVLPMLPRGSAETAPPKNHSLIGWVMPVVLVVCLLIAARLNLLAARSRSLDSAIPLPALAPFISESTLPDASRSINSEERIVVGPDVTPEHLLGFFDEHTSIQAQRLIEPFIGKWMKVSGNLNEVISDTPNRAQVSFSGRGYSSELASVYMLFRTPDSIDRLSILRRGHSLSVVGQITFVNSSQLTLDYCEFEV